MHNFSKLAIPIIAVFSVTSCGAKLRQEVADFIANFSLQKARSEVKKGHYIDSSVGKYKGSDCSFYDEVYFDISEPSIVSYKHVYKSVNYGAILNEDYVEEIVTKDGVYTYTKGEESRELTYDVAYDMTKRFFFSEYYTKTDRYNGAMYYGDMVKDEAYKQQEFVTIDKENGIYRYKIDKVKQQGDNIVMSIDYSINKLGMLLSLADSGYSEDDPTTYYSETITVEY